MQIIQLLLLLLEEEYFLHVMRKLKLVLVLSILIKSIVY